MQKDLNVNKVELSRVLHRFEKAGLVALNRNADRTVTVRVEPETLKRVVGILAQIYGQLVPGGK